MRRNFMRIYIRYHAAETGDAQNGTLLKVSRTDNHYNECLNVRQKYRRRLRNT